MLPSEPDFGRNDAVVALGAFDRGVDVVDQLVAVTCFTGMGEHVELHAGGSQVERMAASYIFITDIVVEHVLIVALALG